jgi:hypothetical protein
VTGQAGDRAERAAVIAQNFEGNPGHSFARDSGLWFRLRHVDQLAGDGIRQRLEQNGVDDRKDRRVCADPQGEGQDRDRGEARRLRHHTQRITQILQPGFEEDRTGLGLVLFANRLDRTEFQHCLAARLRRRQAGSQIFRCLQSQMFLHLFPQAFLVLPPRRRAAQTRKEATQRFHEKSSAFASKNRSITISANVLWRTSAFSFPK